MSFNPTTERHQIQIVLCKKFRSIAFVLPQLNRTYSLGCVSVVPTACTHSVRSASFVEDFSLLFVGNTTLYLPPLRLMNFSNHEPRLAGKQRRRGGSIKGEKTQPEALTSLKSASKQSKQTGSPTACLDVQPDCMAPPGLKPVATTLSNLSTLMISWTPDFKLHFRQ